ncbi:MAG: M6 family metalloprotease domain-containing protein [Kiritimatiellia bacterium]
MTGISRKPNGIARGKTARRALFLFLFFLSPAFRSDAVPACPEYDEAKQPAGGRVRIFLKGDEFLHWHADAAGYTVLRDSAGRWVYAEKTAGGELAPSGALVGEADPGVRGIPKRLLPEREAARGAAMRRLRLPPLSGFKDAARRVPRQGQMKNLVLLVEFADLPHTYSKKQVEALFTAPGYVADGAAGSVNDYFREVSYGALDVDSVVTEWIALDHGYAYYGKDMWGFDIRPREMVEEALAKLEASGFDFSTVDGDRDGAVDCLTVIHAGGGQEYAGNDPGYIWSHQWELIQPVMYDGTWLRFYNTEPERRGRDGNVASQGLARIGVICHEIGHMLGLPDLYDYEYDSEGAGAFCLMAGGSWNGQLGSQPAHLNAWCKAVVGWVAPVPVEAAGSFTCQQVETAPAVYKVALGFPATEHFLVENRQGVGFDRSLPGNKRGLLVWHIDDTVADNDDQGRYRVDLEEASGTQHLERNENEGDDRDYFRAGNLAAFDAETSPGSGSYDGVKLGLSLFNISGSADVMTFSARLEPDAEYEIRRINCGGLAVGNWEKDTNWKRGESAYKNIKIEQTQGVPVAVYKTCRTGPVIKLRMKEVPAGEYRVRLHFAEPTFEKSGQRLLNLSMNGATVLSKFDIVKRAGGWKRPVVRSFDMTIAGKEGLKIVAVGLNGSHALLNGIEIIALNLY